MEPTRFFPIIAVLSLVTVESGGYALLGLLTRKDPNIGPFGFRFFRAGHAHAGVLLVLTLVYFLYLPQAEYSDGAEWIIGVILTAGVIAQSGGFFVHLARGREGENSAGTVITRIGGILLAAALVLLAIGLIRTA
jgi:hypothetical protein